LDFLFSKRLKLEELQLTSRRKKKQATLKGRIENSVLKSNEKKERKKKEKKEREKKIGHRCHIVVR
jgi:hypothetical protein